MKSTYLMRVQACVDVMAHAKREGLHHNGDDLVTMQ